MLNKIFYLIWFLFLASCHHEEPGQVFSVNGGNAINTYSSPSAYYGKPFSRMYVNPYAIYTNQYENDQYYVAPSNSGSTP